ncbi:nuclear transport factor 2 family protein [Mycolicibacter arupensis]|jgi:steroid delta-isomerase-like uncharacterized protein|uniref:SnoaL-like domain-containing protein n=1 Tax=Mycolicibacter arupensis TaxID=342002 RepID=A0A5C7XQT1_9MYCO|nr:nuclear transport factor 2 family protein [Mycolicibacter arupensis]MBX9919722.1 ester cyclase [Mycolicibacterium frederiksbergense]MDM2351370.1 nuclear transport factor 2 family protein [Mycobacteroides abscessus]MDM2361479.1 nuclear transport factor 2 family protein [Mycobacteroides abscessus]TXI51504.1 MAG: hypothetical protein E6Q54_20345 [Mycolicibacter arupensis]
MNSPRDLAAKLFDAYNAHRPDDVAALYAPACVHRDVAMGAHHTAPEHIAAGIATLFTALPDVHWTTGPALVDGNRAAVPYELTGHLDARLGPYIPNGQSLRLSGVQLVEVESGAIVATTDYWDGGALHRQLSESTT